MSIKIGVWSEDRLLLDLNTFPALYVLAQYNWQRKPYEDDRTTVALDKSCRLIPHSSMPTSIYVFQNPQYIYLKKRVTFIHTYYSFI
jgi:hypothetical protein